MVKNKEFIILYIYLILHLFMQSVGGISNLQSTSTQFDNIKMNNQRIGNYTIVRKLVLSGQAILYLAERNGVYFVLKVYQCSVKSNKIYQNEIAILQKLKWKSIVPIEEHLQGISFINQFSQSILCNVITMPYIENGDLLQWILKFGPFGEREGVYFIKKIISTFRYISEKQIYHRDIKPQNILIDDQFQPMILDFGLAIDASQKTNCFVGTARYAAPEVIKLKEYTEKSEIYSLGILFFFILTGKYPYLLAKISEVNYRLIFQKKFSSFWSQFQKKTNIILSNNFKKLFIQMINPDPSKRLNIDEILQFDWFHENQITSEQYYSIMASRQRKICQL